MTFRDHFSDCLASYVRYRPRYPRALFDFVSSLCRRHQTAWDCATGNGQAAIELARSFDRVIATDASSAQIARAVPRAGVEYRVAAAERSGISDATVDLVTVAQALHWFDLDRFFAEVRRVAASGAVIAVWSYGDPVLDPPVLNDALREFNKGVLAAYWPAERHAIGAGYHDLPFPFQEVPAPMLLLEQRWTLEEFAGYLRTWSAVAAYHAARGMDPVTEFVTALGRYWGGDGLTRIVRWPLTVRAGYVGT